jgi:hypothetical protein
MSRIYSIPYSGTYTAAGTDTDLLEILPADDKPVRLLGFTLGQTTEVGDTAEEGVRVSVIRLPATVTSGSGGATPVIAATDSADTAAGFTAEVNNTTIATTSSTAVVLAELGWNERNTPYEFWYPERVAPIIKQGEGLVVRAQTTIADDMSIACTFWLEEM